MQLQFTNPRYWLPLLACLLASPAFAQDSLETSNQPGGLLIWDWVLIGLYAVATVTLGIYFGRQQKTTQEYFTGGGQMNPFLIGVSLFATLLSTISYLSMPGEAAGKGPVGLVGLCAYPLVFVVVAYGLLPVYMKHRVTSAYELLEVKLGLSIRLLGATMFLALRLVWMTLLVYLAAKAMTLMLGLDPGWLPWIVFFTGFVAIIYTSLGGLRAVVITDLMQTILLFGGALLVLAMVTIHLGGFRWIPTEWHPNWDSQPFISFDPKTRATFLGTILTTFTWYVATSGGDQTSVQRFMATKDANAARRALGVQLSVGVTVALTLHLVGFALLRYYELTPSALGGLDLKADADDLFPLFISYELPVGISGLVVAAMFAAAMSSIDSGVNSVTAVVLTDFLGRLGIVERNERYDLRVARILAFGIGLIVVFGSAFMKYIEGNITAVTNKTVNLLAVPIFCLFVFALFIPRATTKGVWVGAICGVATGAAIAFSGPLVYLLHSQFGLDPAVFGVELITHHDPASGATWTTAEDPISFQWIGPSSLIVNLTIGTLASRVLR